MSNIKECLVSVIIPCYNQVQYLDEAFQSILDQTYTFWECLVVNDGSSDSTEVNAKHWCDKDSRFKYLFKENGGLSSARNFGISNANGKFILTLDADDKYHPTFIEKAITLMICNDDVGIISSWGIRFIENEQFGEFKPTGKSIKDFLFCNAAIGTSFFRKKCWEKVGGYDENMKSGYEDWEFYIRVCKSGWNVHIIKEILFFYRQHHVSMRTTALNNYDKDIKKYIFLKHKDLYNEYYDDLIDYFLSSIDLERKNNAKLQKSTDFKLGTNVLRPLRLFKKNMILIYNNTKKHLK